MRTPLIMAMSVVGIIAGTAAAAAADLSIAPARHPVFAAPAPPLVIYAYEPGITLRAYWLPPWHGHHYYPHGKRMSRLGRRQHLSAPRHYVRPAAAFSRSWSNAADFPASTLIGPARPLRDRIDIRQTRRGAGRAFGKY